MITPLRWSLLVPNDRVLVAVSGGPDSLSLLHILWTEQEARGLATVEAAHLDHGLRGDESAAEAVWVADWCAERGIPCHVGRADVAALAKDNKRSAQEAARAARYAFLEEVAARIGATAVATAHTQDDQAETVLMNILRGTGLDGLRGIPIRRGLFVRPFLHVSRAEIDDYCAVHGMEPRRDPSNLSPDHYTRNRVRLELLPQLAREYNPAVAEALLRLSSLATTDLEYLQEQADTALAAATRAQDDSQIVLDRSTLADLHPAMQRRVLRAAIARQCGTIAGVTHAHIEPIVAAIASPHSFSLTLPHPLFRVLVAGDTVTLARRRVSVSTAHAIIPLPVPGKAVSHERGWSVCASYDALLGAVILDADAVRGDTLTVRSWQVGDRVDPLGMGGRHKKVGDIFTDSKVPRVDRSSIPIVTDIDGIIWVAGHCISERVKVTPKTRRQLYLAMG